MNDFVLANRNSLPCVHIAMTDAVTMLIPYNSVRHCDNGYFFAPRIRDELGYAPVVYLYNMQWRCTEKCSRHIKVTESLQVQWTTDTSRGTRPSQFPVSEQVFFQTPGHS